MDKTEFIFAVVFFLAYSSLGQASLCQNGPQEDTVRIQGLLRIQNTADCSGNKMSLYSLNLGLAMEYVLSQINDTDLAVPGIHYELSVEDICDNRSLAVRTTAISLPKSLWTEQQFCSSSSGDDNYPLLLGYLGAAYSSNARPIGEFLSHLKVPLITPSATLAELSDRNKYYSLLRTTVSDNIQSRALVELARNEGWSYVLLMHSNDDYGTQGAKAVKAEGAQKGICFSQTIKVNISSNSSYYKGLAERMMNDGATGVIFFGHSNQALSIISWYLELAKHNTPPKFILASDGVSESPEILREFRQVSDQLGLAVVSTYYTENLLMPFQQFKSHRLQQPITGGTMDKLLDKFKSYCSSSPQCSLDELQKTSDSTQSMIEATIALLSAFKHTHSQLCQSEPGVCEALSNSRQFYHEMVKHLYNSQVNTEIEGQPFSVSFDESEGSINSSSPAYRLSIVNVNTKEYEQVGVYYVNRNWNYTADSPLKFGDSRCKTNCSICQPERPPYQYIRRSSPYIIVGTTPISKQLDSHACSKSIDATGFVRMEAFFYSVEYIKNLTGIDLSTLFIDTCYAEINTHNILNKIFTGSSYADLTTVNNVSERVDVNRIVAVIGDQASSISLAIQTYLRLYELPQISYASTSTWLSDRIRYPTFLRNVPSDDEQSRLMIELVKILGVTEVGLIYQTDSPYALNGGNLVVKHAREKGVCLTYVKTFVTSAYDGVARDLRKTAQESILPRVIIIFADEYVYNPLLKKIKNYNDPGWQERGHVFIASETWGSQEHIIEGVENLVYGSLTFSFSDRFASWTVNEVNYFENFLVQQKPANNQDNPLFNQFWQEQFNCYLADSYSSQSDTPCDLNCKITDTSCKGRSASQSLFLEDILSKHILMAGMSVAYAIREASAMEEVTCEPSNCSELFETEHGRNRFFELLQNVEIPADVLSKRRTYQPFSTDGNGKTNYIISNIVKNAAEIYNRVFSIENGEILSLSSPSFYQGGEPASLSSEKCSTCVCKLGTGGPDVTTTVSSPTEPPLAPTTDPLLIAILAISGTLLLLIIATIFLICQNLNFSQASTKSPQSDTPMNATSSLTRPAYDPGSYEPIPNLPAYADQGRPHNFGNSVERQRVQGSENLRNGVSARSLPNPPDEDSVYLTPSLPQAPNSTMQMAPAKSVEDPHPVTFGLDSSLTLSELGNNGSRIQSQPPAHLPAQPPSQPPAQPTPRFHQVSSDRMASENEFKDYRAVQMAKVASENGAGLPNLAGDTSREPHMMAGKAEPHMMAAKTVS